MSSLMMERILSDIRKNPEIIKVDQRHFTEIGATLSFKAIKWS